MLADILRLRSYGKFETPCDSSMERKCVHKCALSLSRVGTLFSRATGITRTQRVKASILKGAGALVQKFRYTLNTLLFQLFYTTFHTHSSNAQK